MKVTQTRYIVSRFLLTIEDVSKLPIWVVALFGMLRGFRLQSHTCVLSIVVVYTSTYLYIRV